MWKFLARYTTTEEELKEVGIDMGRLDGEHRAHRLLARACVSEELHRSILTTAELFDSCAPRQPCCKVCSAPRTCCRPYPWPYPYSYPSP